MHMYIYIYLYASFDLCYLVFIACMSSACVCMCVRERERQKERARGYSPPTHPPTPTLPPYAHTCSRQEGGREACSVTCFTSRFSPNDSSPATPVCVCVCV